MINIQIDEVPVEEVIKGLNDSIDLLKKKIEGLTDVNLKQNNKIDKQNETITEQIKDIGHLRDEIIKLQQQLIDMQTEDTKERRSIWSIITGKKTEEPKTSRITESTVVLNK